MRRQIQTETGVLNHTAGAEVNDAYTTITLNRDILNNILLNKVTLKQTLDNDESR